ncbi:hypothetical protein GY45DRAFT_1354868 [Cubamyces sp. BRFM 1775]|nr:hypothetical protein GY45DRAFT_1354868 [Cubamyces sp. BRFM 1775]
MTNRSVPLPLEAFLKAFLPEPVDQKPDWTQAALRKKFSGLNKANNAKMKEAIVADRFTKIVNDCEFAPGLKLALSQNRYDSNDASQQKIDGAFFPAASTPTDGKPHWSEQLVSVEFKRHGSQNDPFDDKKVLDTEVEARKNVRSQIMGYAEKVFERQPRTHLFMLFVVGRQFRVLRWDRSGVVVTPRIDYYLHPELLYEFLWRIGAASMEQLGLDPTATLIKPGSAEYQLMDDLSQEVATDLIAKRGTVVAEGRENNMFAYVRKMFRESLAEDWPRWKLSIPQGGGQTRYFLVGKPHFKADGLVGRATQGYVALDPLAKEPKKKLVWLKDAWRTFYDLVDPEGDVLQLLKGKSVPNVPTFVCHGDLPDQATVTPDIWDSNFKAAQAAKNAAACTPTSRPDGVDRVSISASPTSSAEAVIRAPAASTSASGTKRPRAGDDDQEKMPPPPGVGGSKPDDSEEKCPLRRHVHYRIVVEEVGLPLEEFEDGHHLVSVICDCVEAHEQAAKIGILHRDISGGNILIYPRVDVDPSQENVKVVSMIGLLTDWELSKDVTKPKGQPRRARQPERTGTWQYMSVALIDNPKKAVEIPDELEAFFHVLLYYAVRYLDSTCTDVAAYIEHYFEAYRIVNGHYQSGTAKSNTVTTGRLQVSADVELLFNSELDYILRTILQWLQAHYAVRKFERSQKGSASVLHTNRSVSARPKKTSAIARSIDPHRYKKRASDMLGAPSEETISNAQKLQQHDELLALLYASLESIWPNHDKVPDRIPSDAKKQLRTAPTALLDTDGDSSKRRKTNSGVAVPVEQGPRTRSRGLHPPTAVHDSGFASGSKPHVNSCPQ